MSLVQRDWLIIKKLIILSIWLSAAGKEDLISHWQDVKFTMVLPESEHTKLENSELLKGNWDMRS